MSPSSVMKLSPGIYSTKESYKTELINVKHFVGPDLGLNLLLMLSADDKGSGIAMFKIKEAAMGSVARRGCNDQGPIYRSLP